MIFSKNVHAVNNNIVTFYSHKIRTKLEYPFLIAYLHLKLNFSGKCAVIFVSQYFPVYNKIESYHKLSE